MKLKLLGAGILLGMISVVSSPLQADDGIPKPRLTVELRDGSRVVGTSAAEKLKFNSALLGDLSLPVKDIRALECASTNKAKLTTANGDTLSVSFSDHVLALRTGFGKVELTTDSIRKFTVTGSGGTAESGLILNLKFDGSAEDSSGNGLNGTGHEIGFEDGKAAEFNGENSYVSVPKSPKLDLSGPFTLIAWFRFEVGGTINPRILHKGDSYQIYTVGTGPRRRLAFSCTAGGVDGGDARAGQWTFVAGVYDGTTVKLYLDGTLAGQSAASGPLEVNAFDLNIGRNAETQNDLFKGAIDDVKIFSRALSAEEIEEGFKQGR